MTAAYLVSPSQRTIRTAAYVVGAPNGSSDRRLGRRGRAFGAYRHRARLPEQFWVYGREKDDRKEAGGWAALWDASDGRADRRLLCC